MKKRFAACRRKGVYLTVILFYNFLAETVSLDEDFSNCGPPYFGSNEEKSVPPGFVRMGPNSKYFLLNDGSTIKIKDVATYCSAFGLQPAEVRNKLELVAIETFIKEINLNDVSLSLGINDDKDEGHFVEFDGTTSMVFHAFAEGQPSNDNNMENCVALSIHPYSHNLVYMDVACDNMVTPMCMFKTTDRCFLNSPLSLASVERGFSYVGSSPMRDYYVGFRQRTRMQAQKECAKKGYSLVDFNTGLANNQILYDLLKKWMSINSIYTRSQFWTGGKIVPSEETRNEQVPEYRFETSRKLMKDLSDWPSLTWFDGEPNDNSGIGLDQCISAVLLYDYAPTDNQFFLSTTNCRIPLYPLCFKNKVSGPVVTKDIIDNSTTPERKPKEYCPIENIELDLNMPGISHEEIYKLAMFSRTEKTLDSDMHRFKYVVDKPWLADFIDVMFMAVKRFLDNFLVPVKYLNIIHNLIILYYNAAGSMEDPSETVIQRIKNETNFIYKCMDNGDTLEFVVQGGLPDTFEGKSIGYIPETVDADRTYPHLEMIMDAYWFSFQTVIGVCYEFAPSSKTEWLFQIHHLFVKNFMSPLIKRWMQAYHTQIHVDHGMYMGDIDVETAFFTIRVSSVAAFVHNSIKDLYFPRPLYLLVGNKLKDTMNVKFA